MGKNFVLLFMMLAVAFLSGCGQTSNVPPEDTPQEIHTGSVSELEATAEPVVNSEPAQEPEMPPFPQPQADGTGISFMLPDDWNKYPADALQTMIDDLGNRALYGVLHGFMESQEISAVSLVDSPIDDYEYMINYYPSYDVSLNDGTPLRLKFAISSWESEEDGDDEIYFYSVDVYPAFEDYFWSLECENSEGWHDWVCERIWGNPTRYYSISENSLQEYTVSDDYDDYYENPGSTYTPEEPTRLTQYEWPDYCDEIDCLMMEAVGLQYNKTWRTATKLLKSGSIITITVLPKIGGGAEYGANIRVDNSLTIPVKSSDGINYQCRSQGGHGGNMSGYYGKWITLTKDGWSNWY